MVPDVYVASLLSLRLLEILKTPVSILALILILPTAEELHRMSTLEHANYVLLDVRNATLLTIVRNVLTDSSRRYLPLDSLLLV